MVKHLVTILVNHLVNHLVHYGRNTGKSWLPNLTLSNLGQTFSPCPTKNLTLSKRNYHVANSLPCSTKNLTLSKQIYHVATVVPCQNVLEQMVKHDFILTLFTMFNLDLPWFTFWIMTYLFYLCLRFQCLQCWELYVSFQIANTKNTNEQNEKKKRAE